MTESKEDQMSSPEELLARVMEQYDRYLEIAKVSQIPVSEKPESAARPVPLGLVLWRS